MEDTCEALAQLRSELHEKDVQISELTTRLHELQVRLVKSDQTILTLHEKQAMFMEKSCADEQTIQILLEQIDNAAQTSSSPSAAARITDQYKTGIQHAPRLSQQTAGCAMREGLGKTQRSHTLESLNSSGTQVDGASLSNAVHHRNGNPKPHARSTPVCSTQAGPIAESLDNPSSSSNRTRFINDTDIIQHKDEEIAKLLTRVNELTEVNTFYSFIVAQHDEENIDISAKVSLLSEKGHQDSEQTGHKSVEETLYDAQLHHKHLCSKETLYNQEDSSVVVSRSTSEDQDVQSQCILNLENELLVLMSEKQDALDGSGGRCAHLCDACQHKTNGTTHFSNVLASGRKYSGAEIATMRDNKQQCYDIGTQKKSTSTQLDAKMQRQYKDFEPTCVHPTNLPSNKNERDINSTIKPRSAKYDDDHGAKLSLIHILPDTGQDIGNDMQRCDYESKSVTRHPYKVRIHALQNMLHQREQIFEDMEKCRSEYFSALIGQLKRQQDEINKLKQTNQQHILNFASNKHSSVNSDIREEMRHCPFCSKVNTFTTALKDIINTEEDDRHKLYLQQFEMYILIISQAAHLHVELAEPECVSLLKLDRYNTKKSTADKKKQSKKGKTNPTSQRIYSLSKSARHKDQIQSIKTNTWATRSNSVADKVTLLLKDYCGTTKLQKTTPYTNKNMSHIDFIKCIDTLQILYSQYLNEVKNYQSLIKITMTK